MLLKASLSACRSKYIITHRVSHTKTRQHCSEFGQAERVGLVARKVSEGAFKLLELHGCQVGHVSQNHLFSSPTLLLTEYVVSVRNERTWLSMKGTLLAMLYVASSNFELGILTGENGIVALFHVGCETLVLCTRLQETSDESCQVVGPGRSRHPLVVSGHGPWV